MTIERPRVTKGELKSVLQGGGQGPRGVRNAILEGKVQVGGKAADFLNRQLEKVGGKPLPKVQTKSDPAPKGGGQKQQPMPVIGLINKAGQPGTTNMKPQAQPKKQEAPKQQAPKQQQQPKQQAPKPAAPKAEAKKKAEAKSSGGKKK